ncbi:MAG: glycosyltransferase [Bacteroidota bacterium]
MDSKPKKIVIIGNPYSVFPTFFAEEFQKFNHYVQIVSRNVTGKIKNQNETEYISTSEYESVYVKILIRIVVYFISPLENLLIFLNRSRYKNAMGSESVDKPKVSTAIIEALSISHYVNNFKPDFVYGQEVFTYGLATAWVKNCPRIVMPWGGDIFMYANTSWMASKLVKYILNSVDLINPTAASSFDYMKRNFAVNVNKFHATPWCLSVDNIQQNLQKYSKAELKKRLNIPKDSTVIMNVRRLKDAWGANSIIKAFVNLARKRENIFFIVVVGAAPGKELKQLDELVTQHNLQDKFLIKRDKISPEEYSLLVCASEIFTSFMIERDMRSSSIVQGLFANSLPIINDQPEYRLMENQGMKAIFADPNDHIHISNSIDSYIYDTKIRRDTLAKNLIFLKENHSNEKNFSVLLDRIELLLLKDKF